MSIFPFITNDIPVELNNNDTMPMYKEIGWNFEYNTPTIVNGDFKIVEGNEAIKVWIYKAINTVRYEHSIYSWDYGCEVNNLFGKGYTKGYTKSEAERYIKECILINPYINSVRIVDIDFVGDKLFCSVEVNTIYGEVSMDV